ncbi:hypothetical protein GCM10027562_35140 [Arthrobacter pigmenti]
MQLTREVIPHLSLAPPCQQNVLQPSPDAGKCLAHAALRDAVMRLVSVETAIKPIQRLLADGPDPDATARAALGASAAEAAQR